MATVLVIIESELLGPRGAFLATGYDILPVTTAHTIHLARVMKSI